MLIVIYDPTSYPILLFLANDILAFVAPSAFVVARSTREPRIVYEQRSSWRHAPSAGSLAEATPSLVSAVCSLSDFRLARSRSLSDGAWLPSAAPLESNHNLPDDLSIPDFLRRVPAPPMYEKGPSAKSKGAT